MRTELIVFAAVALCAAGCGAAEPASEEVAATEAGVSGPLYYFARPDYRKCMYPMCGGIFIRRANFEKTKCADKTWNDECYVADVDYTALGLSDEEQIAFQTELLAGHAIVRGSLSAQVLAQGTFGGLTAVEGYRGVTGAEPVGKLFLLEDSGIQCFTYPCPTIHERKLNSIVQRNIDGVDLTETSATLEQIDAAFGALYSGTGFVAAGTHRAFSGPGGTGKELVASEFYMRVEGAGVQCGDTTCSEGTYCCNPSCSMCVPEGAFCTQEICY